MKSRKVIDRKNLPTKFPVIGTYVIIQGLHYWNATQLIWGIVLTLIILIWIGLIISFVKEEEENIIDKN